MKTNQLHLAKCLVAELEVFAEIDLDVLRSEVQACGSDHQRFGREETVVITHDQRFRTYPAVDVEQTDQMSDALGPRADWQTPLSEALLDMLSGLLDRSELSLRVQLDNPRAERAAERTAELRQLALLEWAHRLQTLLAPNLTLAAPAAMIQSIDLNAPLFLDLAWMAGSSVTLRRVRVLRPKEMGHAVTG